MKKKLLLLLICGLAGSAFILRHQLHNKEIIHFVEDSPFDPDTKNFGAFPPDIPEQEVDALFI